MIEDVEKYRFGRGCRAGQLTWPHYDGGSRGPGELGDLIVLGRNEYCIHYVRTQSLLDAVQ